LQLALRREETLEVLDGFKRVAAAPGLGLVNLRCQVLAADERQAKVALLTLHGAGKRLVERVRSLWHHEFSEQTWRFGGSRASTSR